MTSPEIGAEASGIEWKEVAITAGIALIVAAAFWWLTTGRSSPKTGAP